jgi:hypothetical protein
LQTSLTKANNSENLNSVIQLRLQIQSGLRKQVLFESFDPVDVTFSSWFPHYVQHRQCLMWLPRVVEKWQRKKRSSQQREIICYLC